MQTTDIKTKCESGAITFQDRADVRLCDLIARLRRRYDLNPDTNEDYRKFLIAEGALPKNYKPKREGQTA